MPQELKIKVADGIARAEVSGAFNPSNAKAFFRKILGHARDQGLSKILIDARHLEGDVSTMERFDFGSFMSEMRPAAIRIAFVGSAEAVWSQRFLETVAVNRGVIAKVTTNPTEAIEWLKQDPANKPAGGDA